MRVPATALGDGPGDGRRARPGRRGGTPTGSLLAASIVAASLLVAGCATGPLDVPEVIERTPLPPIPERTGPPSLYVAYPDSLARIAASDSNFLFGTTATGAASLTVNGRPVAVEPNGAFLAWLPVPEPVSGDTAEYRLVARTPEATDSAVHRVLVPGHAPSEREGPWIDSASVAGLDERWALPGAELSLGMRAAPGLEAWASANGLRVPLREVEPGRYRGRAAARRLHPSDTDGRGGPGWTGPERPTGVPELPPPDTVALRLSATDGTDTVTREALLPLRLLRPGALPVATLVEEPHPVHGTAGAIPGRPTPRGSYAWLFPPGSGGAVDARIGDRVRLRLGSGAAAWIEAADVRLEAASDARDGAAGVDRRVVPTGAAAIRAAVGRVSAERRDDRTRVRVRVERRLPAHARMAGPHTLELVVHGGLGETERMVYGEAGATVRSLDWEQLPGPRWRLRVETGPRIWGWDLRWSDVGAPIPTPAVGGSASSAAPGSPAAPTEPPSASEPGMLVLDVRRPPSPDPDRPLRGITVAIDPGHPPAGAEGPTGLTEAEANLAVARRLSERLRDAGARPVVVRADTSAMGLYERRRRAREAGAELLVSIHNNALPDGVRPFGREGTSTYYFHPHALPLAAAVQRGMLAAMGLRDLGVRWGNFALPRERWMPSVLTEGAFMMFPRHEAALRTEAFQDAYARGVEAGLRQLLAEVAEEAPRFHF